MVDVKDRRGAAFSANSRGGIGRARIDVQRVAKALSGPGNDTRVWLEDGTVGVLDERGTFRTDDPEAVFVDPDGAVVSVRLEPSGDIVTASYAGLSCGRYGFMLIPVRPGDQVQVAIPGGNINSDSIEIVRILSNRTAQIPTDWNNDRVLFDLNVPFEVRGPAVRISSANLVLNGRKVNAGPEDL